MTGGREAASGPEVVGIVAIADVGGEQREPRFAEVVVDDLEQRPDEALGTPRVLVAIDAGGFGQHVADQPAGKRELDVRADPVGRVRRRSEPGAEAVGEPAFDAAGRHRHHLGRERVAQRIGEEIAERADERIGSFAAVDAEHVLLGQLDVTGRA